MIEARPDLEPFNFDPEGLRLVLEIARRMGVTISVVADAQADEPGVVFYDSPTGEFATRHREVCIDETATDLDWAFLLHEVSHAVWCPPGWSTNDDGLDETIGQDQWERTAVKAVVRALGLPERLLQEHLDFQEDSTREEHLNGFPHGIPGLGLEQWPSYVHGYGVAVSTGALGVDHEPTWCLPDYTRVGELLVLRGFHMAQARKR